MRRTRTRNEGASRIGLVEMGGYHHGPSFDAQAVTVRSFDRTAGAHSVRLLTKRSIQV